METPRVRLGELLVRAGLLTAEQLEEALAEQARVGGRLGSLIVESGLVSETQVTQILSQQLSVPWVSLHHIDFSRQLLDLIPLDVVERYCLIPIYVRRVRGLGDALYIAMDDPTNGDALKDVAERSGLHVRAMIAPPSDIRRAIRAYYGIGPASLPPPAPAVERDDEEADVPTGIHPRVVAPRPAEERSAPRAVAAPPMAPVREPPRVAQGSRPDTTPLPRAAAVAVAVADVPPSSPVSTSAEDAAKRAKRAAIRKMIALTFLDGTTLQLPTKGKGRAALAGAAPVVAPVAESAPIAASAAASAPVSEPRAAPVPEASVEAAPASDRLTARDLLAALRAAAHGADASEVLGENVRWEAMFAALLSLLIKKRLITDLEFVEEYKKV